jgi:hypothetical protein
MIATNAPMRSDEVFIASITQRVIADSLLQIGKSNKPVTSPDCRSALSKRSSLNDPNVCLAKRRLRSEDGTYDASRIVYLHGAPYAVIFAPFGDDLRGHAL